MNQDSVFGERKQVSLLVIAVIVLAGAILVSQLLPSVDVAGRPAPASEQDAGAASGAAALASPSQALLDRDLKEVWRAHISLPGSRGAIAAPGQSLLDTDLKAIWRANAAVPSNTMPDLLDRDLKEIWRAQTAAGDNTASLLQDRSGLEREIKAIWRANTAAGSGARP